MPLVQTRGAASAQGFGEFAQVTAVNYIEDVFSTWLVTPTSSNTTYSVTNGIDVSGKGGMVWMKSRSASGNNLLYDTARGASAGSNNALISNSALGQQTANFDYITGLSNGFTVNFASGGGQLTNDGINYVSWTFREQPKFFDVVTYTGTGANRTIAHSLGSVPGCIIVKRTDTTANWAVYHRSLANTQYLVLNSTAAAATGATWWNSTTPTSSVFSVGTDASVNASGGTYVAYIYAHDAGGFGLTGTDNVISCGSWTSTGSEVSTTLGYEPQWLLYKRASVNTGNWAIADNMRGVPTGSDSSLLNANYDAAEAVGTNITFSATGFSMSVGNAGDVWIYIAIRRGPMKVPTLGTSVYNAIARTGTGAAATITGVGFAPDLALVHERGSLVGFEPRLQDRLRGVSVDLATSSTAAEVTGVIQLSSFNMNGISLTGPSNAWNYNGETFINWFFQRAPSFFDEVCYTGTGANTTQAHNLGVVPELIIVKGRSGATAWDSYCSALANTEYLVLNTTAAKATGATRWNSTTPTSSVFSIGTSTTTNTSAATYVAYLFATCAGVSKVGSYTGNGTTQTINCGFSAGGARFVLIKRSDSTGGWYVYDTARGMTLLTDPYLFLNTTAAEVATLGSVTTVSTGFALDSAVLAAINVSAATYIFLAIA